MAPKIRVTTPFVFLFSIVLSGCERTPQQPPRQVILILLDAARPDRFSSYGYRRETTPAMDALAKNGVVFRQHYAQSTHTRASVPSYVYSRYFTAPIFPNSQEVPFSHPSDLFQRPDDASVSFVKAFERAGARRRPFPHTPGRGKTRRLPRSSWKPAISHAATSARVATYELKKVIDYAIKWIRDNRRADFFLYIHIMDTHFPHYFEEDAQRFFGASTYDTANFTRGGLPRDLAKPVSAEGLRYLNALYDGSLRYTDRQIGRLIDQLRDSGRLDQTLIAITADHGENLLEGPGLYEQEGLSILTHEGPWFDPVARVPLLVHFPDVLDAGVYEQFSEGVDVGPSLLGLSNVPVPDGKVFDGVDLFDMVQGRAAPKTHVLSRRGIRTATHKCLFDTSEHVLLAEEAPDPAALDGRLYDMQADPGEATNLFYDRPEIVRDMLDLYRESMMRPYRRFVAARTSEQPRSAFAIAAEHFNNGSPSPETASGWEHVGRCLESRGPEPLLAIEFPMPNGTYELAVNLRGAAIVKVGEQAGELRSGERHTRAFGDVHVTGETFRAVIRPAPGQPTAVCFLGFIPSGVVIDEELRDERLERLRTLGYVQ